MQNGYVRKNNQTKEQPDEKTSFLPYHPVTNENKPGKLRYVANASSVFQGQSLNSNLLKGPDLVSNLTGVILVILIFRKKNIALSVDIEQMFMQVKVAPEENSHAFFGTMMIVLKITSTSVTFLEPQTHHVLPNMLCKKLFETTNNSFQMLSNR